MVCTNSSRHWELYGETTVSTWILLRFISLWVSKHFLSVPTFWDVSYAVERGLAWERCRKNSNDLAHNLILMWLKCVIIKEKQATVFFGRVMAWGHWKEISQKGQPLWGRDDSVLFTFCDELKDTKYHWSFHTSINKISVISYTLTRFYC